MNYHLKIKIKHFIYCFKAINLGWWYWMSKFADLLDTFFYVLRKKNDNITFLHLYHHISVPVFGYMLIKINPMLPATHLFIIINTFIHCCMYSYYALAAIGPGIRKYLWWKRYITVMQLSQFLFGVFYSFFVIKYQRGYPLFWLCFGLTQPPFFFYIFYQFYQRSYKNDKTIVHIKQSNQKILNHYNSNSIFNSISNMDNGSSCNNKKKHY